MLRPVTFVMGLLMSLSASASIYDTNFAPDNGRQYGLSEKALAVCQSISSSYYANSCVVAIQGKRFSYAAASSCGAIQSDYYKLECIQTIANQYIQREAANSCSGISDYNRVQCLKNVANHAYQAEAVTTCTGITSDYYKNSCLTSIQNKLFDTRLLNFCVTQNQYSDYNKLSCINQLQYRSLDADYSTDYLRNNTDASIDLSVTIDLGTGQVILGGRVNQNDQNDYRDSQFGQRHNPFNDILVQRDDRRNDNVNNPARTANTCVVKQTGERVNTNDFYNLVSRSARIQNKCAVGRLANTDRSSQLFDQSGRRLGASQGGLSYRELNELKRDSNLHGTGCVEFICDTTK